MAGASGSAAGRFGVDIEYADPARNWDGILEMLSGEPGRAHAPLHGAMIWTACEAVFKAVGHFPTQTGISDIAMGCEPNPNDRGRIVAQRCGPVLLLSVVLPVDRRFAVSVAIECEPGSVDPNGALIEMLAAPHDGEDCCSAFSIHIPSPARMPGE